MSDASNTEPAATQSPRAAIARREPCPECYEICGWCSWYRMNAREGGCGCPPYGKRRVKCEKAEALKGTECGTCDGSGEVLVERRILKTAGSPIPQKDTDNDG